MTVSALLSLSDLRMRLGEAGAEEWGEYMEASEDRIATADVEARPTMMTEGLPTVTDFRDSQHFPASVAPPLVA